MLQGIVEGDKGRGAGINHIAQFRMIQFNVPANNLYHPLRILAIKEEAAGVKTFMLEPLDGKAIEYKAGQFLTFVFQHHHKEERRSFSISSSPGLDEPLSITVKRIDNGVFTRYLIDSAKPGDVLYTTGAAGLFAITGEVAAYEQIFFIAAGIGIVPVFSMLKSLLRDHADKRAVLLYSNRVQEHVVFYKELQELLAAFPGRLKIEFLYSSAFALSRARLNKALLPQLIDEYAVTAKDKMLFYTCGPFDYMRMVILALEEYGISAQQIKKENFDISIPVKKAEPPDKEAHLVVLKMNEDVYELECRYPETILQAAKKKGIQIPYSCEAGRCGSCAVVCKQGKVWMSVNEVLTERDLEKGLVLTCVGYPVGGDASLEI